MSTEIEAINSQGFINQPSGPVNQHFGDDIIATEGSVVVSRSPGTTIQIIQSLVRPAPFTYRPRLQRMIEDYTTIFGGRDEEIANLDAWLTDPNRPWGLLLSPTGRGKTALLIHWALRLQEQGQVRVAFHSISLRYETATADATFRSLAHTLASWYNEPPPEAHTSPDHLRVIVADYLRQPLPDERPAVVLIDGLDEAISWQVSRDLFPRQLSPGLKVLASTRQLAHGDQATWLERLGWERRQTRAFTLGNLKRATVASILQTMGNWLDQLATNVDLVGELCRVSEGDPLTVRLLIEALQNEELTPEQLTRQPRGLDEYLESWLCSLQEAAVDSPAVYSLLNACAIALGPLTTTDLAALAPDELGTGLRLRQAVRTVERFIIGDGQPASGYVFSHPRLREAFVKRLLTVEAQTWQEKFVDYGRRIFILLQEDSRYRKLEVVALTPDPQPLSSVFPDYIRQFWPNHLANNGDWDELEQVLNTTAWDKDKPFNLWAELSYTIEGSYSGYLAGLDLLWKHANDQFSSIEERSRGMALQLRCALIFSSIRSMTENISPEILIQLVTVGTLKGKWSPAVALAHAGQMPRASKQAEALIALAPHLPIDLLAEALTLARAIENESTRAHVLASLASYLPFEQQVIILAEALADARAIEHSAQRTRALADLAMHFPKEQQATILAEAWVAACAIEDESECASALVNLAPRLPPELLTETLVNVCYIRNSLSHADALIGLTPYLPPELLPEVLDIAHTIEYEPNRAKLLISLVPRLSSEQQDAVLAEAISVTYFIRRANIRVETLAHLASYLPFEQRSSLLAEALAFARAIENASYRAEALTNLVSNLSLEQQAFIQTEALDAIRCIENGLDRAHALVNLCPHLRPDQLTEALAVAQDIKNELARGKALTGLILHLPPDLLIEALTTARAIGLASSRAHVLANLVPHLPSTQQVTVLTEALLAARVIEDETYRAKILTSLALRLPFEQQTKILIEALTIARSIRDEYACACTLTKLVPYLSSEHQTISLAEALAAARANEHESYRVRALINLIPCLPSEQQTAILTEALNITHNIRSSYDRARVLADLASHLPPERLAEALVIVHTIEGESDRVLILVNLAQHLPTEQRTALLAEALFAAKNIGNESVRHQALISLVPYLPPDMLNEILTIVSDIEIGLDRACALADLAPYLLTEQKDAILTEALTIAHNIWDESKCTYILGHLAPHLSPYLLNDALAIAKNIKDESSRSEALVALVPYLLSEQQAAIAAEALHIAYKIKGELSRARTLAKLIPHLPPEQQSTVLAESLALARNIWIGPNRFYTLADLAPLLTIWTGTALDFARNTWLETLPDLACHHREEFLIELDILVSWIKVLGDSATLTELARAIVDVDQWWP